jgi:hypothetical protein
MTGIDKARELFQRAGLAFPMLPKELAAKLKERDSWVYSTRPVRTWAYELDAYVREAQEKRVRDYALLAHSGHGVNSYAIQYYLVHGHLRMFLHLGWGGVYEDRNEESDKVHACFSKADEVVRAMVRSAASFHTGEHLTIIGSDFYGSYWIPPGPAGQRVDVCVDGPMVESPLAALTEVLHWLATLNGELSSPKNATRKTDRPPSHIRRKSSRAAG